MGNKFEDICICDSCGAEIFDVFEVDNSLIYCDECIEDGALKTEVCDGKIINKK